MKRFAEFNEFDECGDIEETNGKVGSSNSKQLTERHSIASYRKSRQQHISHYKLDPLFIQKIRATINFTMFI